MKSIEQKIIELAKEYAEFGTKIRLPLTHNEIGCSKEKPWRSKGRQITIYLNSNYKTWAVYFGDYSRRISVAGYSERIEKPWNITDGEMIKIYEDAKAYLGIISEKMIESAKENAKKRLAEQIKKLEDQLKTLKSQS